MYFERSITEKILSAFSKLLRNEASKLWMDYIDPTVFDGTSRIPVVRSFTEAMQCLGEPFINGFSDIALTLERCKLFTISDVPSDVFIRKIDPVFNLYRFCIAGCVSGPQEIYE